MNLDERAEELVPHLDDFNYKETLFAQEVCICINAAIDCCLAVKRPPRVIINISFKPLRKGRCLAITGKYWDLGESPEGIIFDKEILQDPIIKKEINLQREDLALLNSQEELSKDIILTLKNRAQQNQWKASDILNTPGVFEFPIMKSFIEGPNCSE